ncbi:hypothetical protein Dda_4056 [Drechslerella dactyloides]|uniref:Ribosomal protein L9 domain-containing protein n=1 Tax=Drechslerella dactyloides TaxID=74499 RepID=A0AAD6NJ32_DREDA|nr:hypothetical protein Dda_4056 [Drechslerella dactyloides]
MSTTPSLASILRATAPHRGGSSSSVLLRPSTLSICSSCLRSLNGYGFVGGQQVRGKKTLPKAIGVKVRLLKDIPGYGPKGSIMMVARGRMRTIWYQRGEAEYLTRDLAKQIGKYTLVERDPGFQPVVVEREKGATRAGAVRDTLLTPAETVATLSATLPPFIRFFRATTTPYAITLHGSVTTADVANAIKLIAAASKHPNGSRVVVNADNITFVKQMEKERVKTIGEYEVEISFKGQETIKRSVVVTREEEDAAGGGGVSAGAGSTAGATAGVGVGTSIFKTPPQRREL